MRPRTLWPEDPKFIEIGVRDGALAECLRHEGYTKYLGVSGDKQRIANLQRKQTESAADFVCANRPKLVRENNADVLVLSGRWRFFLWKLRSVRHAKAVLWSFSLHPLSLLALLGCLWHRTSKSYSWPRIVTFRDSRGTAKRMFCCRVLRPKVCRRAQLHFIPHRLGVTGMFQTFDRQSVRYAVLRWFDDLPNIKPHEDLDMLVADNSLAKVLQILEDAPGIQPCDVYSEHGLARSDYCTTPYYPSRVACRILDGAERRKQLFMAPNRWDYFHSLAYHTVYHKGLRSDLDRGDTGLKPRGKPAHDYAAVLKEMAEKLGIEVEISLEGLHAYLQETGWGPSPEMLARLSVACSGNKWLRLLTQRLDPHVHDQGLTVFVLRRGAFEHGYQERMTRLIEESGFEILVNKVLSPREVEVATPRTRGGNWGTGPFDKSGGPPAAIVVAYDSNPLPLSRRQRRKFPLRTNARIFVKEKIRDIIVAELPKSEGCNALHSSDHAAEAWHLIEVLAPERMNELRETINSKHRQQSDTPTPIAEPIRRAA